MAAGFGHILKEFCKNSSIHGLQYVLSGKGSLVAGFWLSAILLGIFTTIVLFYEASGNWYSHPSLTTIESMAMPIRNVQFPTVTVCPGKEGQVFGHGMDTWALVHKLLNQLQMYCSPQKIRGHYYIPCDEGFQPDVDRDFGFVLHRFQSELWELVTANHSDLTLNKREEYDEIVEELARRFEANVTSLDAVKSFYSGFRRFKDMREALEAFIKPLNSSNLPAPSNDTKAFVGDLIKWIRFVYPPGMSPGLGNIFFTLLPLFFDAFKRVKPYSRVKCSRLSEEEVWLGKFLVKVSQQLGFSSHLNLALHELPVLFSKFNPEYKFNSMKLPYFITLCFTLDEEESGDHTLNRCMNQWNDYLRGVAEHPCQLKDAKPRCCWTERLGKENLTSIMKVMKHARGRGALYQDLREMTDFTKGHNGSLVGYKTDPFGYGEHRYRIVNSKKDFDPFTAIPICQFVTQKRNWGRQKFILPACDLFQPMMTTMGMCHSFNSLSMHSLLRDSPFKDAFSNAYKYEPRWEQIHRVQASGEELGLVIYLDAGSYFSEQMYKGRPDTKRTFQLSMNNYLTPFNMKSTSLTIRPGYRSILRVTPMELRSEDELQSVEPHRRGCFFHNEPQEGSVFQNYTRPGCVYECLAKYAASYCKCAPWDMPFPGSEGLPVCGLYGYYCFDEVMKNGSFSMNFEKDHECDCLPNCNELYYTYTKEEWPIDPADLCDYGSIPSIAALMKIRLLHADTVNLYYRKKFGFSVRDGKVPTAIRFGICRKFLAKDLAIVNIHFASDMYMRSKQSVKMTFGDQIASLGGTLGLLTGMSVMSLVEVVFWLCRSLNEIFNAIRGSNRGRPGN